MNARDVAIHEAGHAVIALEYRRRGQTVRARIDGTNDDSGLVQLQSGLRFDEELGLKMSGTIAELVFCHSTRGSRADHEWYAREFRAALAAAGVEGYVRPFHDLRHSALTNLAATSASPTALMATAGYRSMATTRQHLAGVVFRDEAESVERRLFGASEPVEPSTRLT